MKKFYLLPALIVLCLYTAAQVKTIKIPPNKDTVIVTTITTTNVIPAQVTTNTSVTTSTIPGPVPGPDPIPGTDISVNLSFVPAKDYYERPFAGPEDWQGQNYAPIGNGKRLDFYDRLGWTQLEGPAQGQYTWGRLDGAINKAIDNGQKYSVGIMAMCPGGCDPYNGTVNYDGSSSLYPLYLHKLMQSETVKDRILGTGGKTWVPNWNSPNFLNRLDALNSALAQHINTTSYKGIQYKHVVNYIDIRIMGSYGEWHHAGIVDNMNQYPAGMRPTVASYKRIIDSYLKYFPDNWLAMILATLDANFFNNTLTPPEVTWYALNVKNNVGPLAIRSDQRGSEQWNSLDNYVHRYMELNTRSYQNSGPFNAVINERWKSAPLLGEPENNNDNPQLQTLSAQFNMYHQNSIGNGNYKRSAQADNNMKSAAAIAGHRIGLTGGKVTYSRSHAEITLLWQNTGIAPNYENWNVTYQVTGSGGAVVWTGNSTFKPKLFLPALGPSPVNEDFTFNPPLAAGAYMLRLLVVDPNGYRKPLPLNIEGRDNQGGYLLTTLDIK